MFSELLNIEKYLKILVHFRFFFTWIIITAFNHVLLGVPIGNVQFYFVLRQFCRLDGVANLNQNIGHHKVTAVSPFCDFFVTNF